MKILFSDSRVAESNLNLEQQLLSGLEEVVLLYVNDRAVVVGRNQTIEAEVDCAYCQEHNIAVVRRQSGGGTVYHDKGNLNYAIICNSSDRPLDRDYTEPIVWALNRLGIAATTGSRGEITVGDAKISGSSSMIRRGRVLFHGTLLFDSDLEALDAALRGNTTLQHKGVKSVHSKVCNLKPLLPNIEDMPQFISAITAALTEYYAE